MDHYRRNSNTFLKNAFDSKIENSLLNSQVPVPVDENEEITVLGHRGVWVNKNEVLNWRGPVPLSNYKLNEDSQPEVVYRTSGQPVEYNQEIQVRYLRPPTPQAPGDLIIKQEQSVQIPHAPPQIIRQHAPRPLTPEPLIIREAPPEPPVHVPHKIINLVAPPSDAPPRKVIIEKMPALPPKPQPVVIERWLPYKEHRRRVIFQGAPTLQSHDKVRNLVIQWQSPQANIKKNIKYLGTVNADPKEYIAKHGTSLKKSHELPSFVNSLDGNQKFVPVAKAGYYELEGDVDALKYLDLEKEGLGMYRHYLSSRGIQSSTSNTLQSSIVNVIQHSVESPNHSNIYQY